MPEQPDTHVLALPREIRAIVDRHSRRLASIELALARQRATIAEDAMADRERWASLDARIEAIEARIDLRTPDTPGRQTW